MTDLNEKPPRPTRAMVLAAGLGLRMREVSATRPKPLVSVDGRALIDHALDRLAAAGVETVVVNLHHLADLIREHLAGRTDLRIEFSVEEELLETGGGVMKALDRLGPDPFYVVNADALWVNGPYSALERLADSWHDDAMDALLLIFETVEAKGYDGVGDFLVEQDGRLSRRPEQEVSPYLFTGVQILHPRLFDGAPRGKFSLNLLYDRAIEAERLYGVIHDGVWFHVGSSAGLSAAEEFMTQRFPEKVRR
jgi:MurNAc alpha-1-phosphate uridylyltransferase